MSRWPGRITVVGASVASAALIERSRELGFTGEFTVIDHDRNAPYDRPPLSKQFLLGPGPVERAEWWPDGQEILAAKAIGLLRLRDWLRVLGLMAAYFLSVIAWLLAYLGEGASYRETIG